MCAYVCVWKSVLKRLNGRGLAVTPNKQDLSIKVHYKTPPIQMDFNKQKTMLKRQNGRGLAVTSNKQVLSIKVNRKLHLFRWMLLIIKKPLITYMKIMKYYFIFSYLCIIFVDNFFNLFFFQIKNKIKMEALKHAWCCTDKFWFLPACVLLHILLWMNIADSLLLYIRIRQFAREATGTWAVKYFHNSLSAHCTLGVFKS